MSIFKAFGVLAIALGTLALVAVVANVGKKGLGGHNLAPLAGVAVLSLLIGFGLLWHRKWAAVLFAVLLGGTGLWMGVMSIVRVPMPWLILNVGLACLLLAPGAVIVRRWSQLDGE
jgi:hypothetical protein